MSNPQTKEYRILESYSAEELETAVNAAAKQGFVITYSTVKALHNNLNISYPLRFVVYMERSV